jgi:hypothetical protein
MNGNTGNISKENKLNSYELKTGTKETVKKKMGTGGKSMSRIRKEIDVNNVQLDTADRYSGKKNGG